jgi:hypothetical protein
MLRLHALQDRWVTRAVRLHSTLRLPGAPWAAVPLYNRVVHWLARGRANRAASSRRNAIR